VGAGALAEWITPWQEAELLDVNNEHVFHPTFALRIGIQAERKETDLTRTGQETSATHDDVSGVFVSTNVGVLDDQCALEVPEHAWGDVAGELGGPLGFREVVEVFLFFLHWAEVHLRGCCGGRY